jgi:hypothetical protein
MHVQSTPASQPPALPFVGIVGQYSERGFTRSAASDRAKTGTLNSAGGTERAESPLISRVSR